MRALLPALVLSLAVPAATAQPGDDWAVSRDPFDPSVIARYKGLLARNPHDAPALAKLLSLYRRFRTVDQLKNEYRKASDKAPNDASNLIVLARIELTGGDSAAALGLFERAAKLGADPAVALEIGTLYRNAGRGPEAKTAFEAALRGTGQKKKALRALADLALAAGDVAAARTYFDQFIAAEPKNAQLRLELGDALLAAGKHAEAIAVFRKAEPLLASDPGRRVELISRLGQALEGQGDDDGAITEYRRAIGLAPRGYYIEVELTNRIVDIYRRKQDLAGLLSHYEGAWPPGRRGHFEWNTLAHLYEETGNQAKAITAYQKAVAKAPYELETQRRLIQLLEQVGRDNDALAQLEVAVRVAPGEARFQLELAERFWRLGHEKKALDALKKLEGRFPGDAGVGAAIADLYTRWGKADLALATFERLAKLEPDEPAHLITLGEQYLARGDRSKALAIWKKIGNAKTATALARLGQVLSDNGLGAEALAHFAKAIKLEPKNPALYKGRAQIHEAQKNYSEALADLEVALSLVGQAANDRVARRELRSKLVALLTRAGTKEVEYRARWIRDFLHKTPPDLEAGYFLIAYYARRPTDREPRNVLEKMRSLVPDDVQVLTDLVKSYRDARRFDDAVAILLEIAGKSPGRERDLYTQIADIEREARRDAEALDWMQKALAKTPNDPVAYEHLAHGYVEMQRFGEAITAYERVIELDRRNFPAHFALAQLYLQDGRTDKASNLYRDVLRRASEDELLIRASREAMDLEELNDTLGELEKVVAPLAFTQAHRPIYRQILVDLYLRYVPHLAARARNAPPEVRTAIQAELKRVAGHGLRPLLEALADDRDLVQQRNAVQILAYLGNPGAAQPLIHLARREPRADSAGDKHRVGGLGQAVDWDLRVKALIAAGRLGASGVLDELAPLAEHVEPTMREAAIFAIGRTHERAALPYLVTAIADRRETIQVLGCLGLAQLNDARSASAAIGVVTDRRRPELSRAACAFALGAQRSQAGVASLIAALGDAGELQRLAAWSLGAIREPKARASLVRAYFTRDDQQRGELTWALARLADPAVPLRQPDLSDYPAPSGKYQPSTALDALPGELPTTVATPELIVGHEADLIAGIRAALAMHRDVAVNVLGDLDTRSDGIGLGALLPPGTLDARTRASVTRIGEAIASDLTAATRDSDPQLRSLAISVLSKHDGPGVDLVVEQGLTDVSVEVRSAAIRAVATLSQRRGGTISARLVTALRGVLGGSNWRDRSAAATAMGVLGVAGDSAALVAATGDDISFVREAAVAALTPQHPGALEALLVATGDEVAAVRSAAAAALAKFSDPRARARRRELAERDPDAAVRAAARE